MNYRGPQPADFLNVQALNTAFLEQLLTKPGLADQLLAYLPESQAARFLKLTPLQRERLARAPFLLFSFQEDDSGFWQQLFNAGPNRTLFDKVPRRSIDEAELTGAALGFVWQLARDNSYAARLVCGASLHWCEQIAEQALLHVVSAAGRADVMRLRRERDTKLWQKLLFAGVASERTVRRAARIGALQCMLTEIPQPPLALAARRLRRPSLKVAESNEH